MPATGLKIVGSRACLSWCSISLSYGYEFLEFCFWNLVLFLPDRGFQLLKSSWSFLTYFCLMMLQMFSIDERSGLKAGQFSTQTLLWWSHAIVIAAVCGLALSCWNTQALPWNRSHLQGTICCFKPLYTFQHSRFLPILASCPYCIHLCISILSEMLAFELNADNMLEGLPPL